MLAARSSATLPDLAEARARLGLCLLSAGQRERALQMANLSARAFTEQPGVSSFYKRPLIELRRKLVARDIR
jgi:hypothetical protein